MCADQVPYRPQALFKRDGQEVPFEAAKIERAIAAAGQANENDHEEHPPLPARLIDREHGRVLQTKEFCWSIEIAF